jgi:hypothetical protein
VRDGQLPPHGAPAAGEAGAAFGGASAPAEAAAGGVAAATGGGDQPPSRRRQQHEDEHEDDCSIDLIRFIDSPRHKTRGQALRFSSLDLRMLREYNEFNT